MPGMVLSDLNMLSFSFLNDVLNGYNCHPPLTDEEMEA